MRRKKLYPGLKEAELEKSAWKKGFIKDEQPDFIGTAPNYEKFRFWPPEKVLMHLNVD